MIPEYVPNPTSITTGRGIRISALDTLFIYHHIKPAYFNGLRQIALGNHMLNIAFPEKALFDKLYIFLQKNRLSVQWLDSLRLQNIETFDFDLNPPADWQGEKTIVDIHMPVVLQHYRLASLYARKLHAVLMRHYTKGRDIYDLFWYRSKHKALMPNFEMLNNPVAQTTKNFPQITEENWLTILGEAAERLDWSSVENDVAPFLEHRDELITFTWENVLMLLKI